MQVMFFVCLFVCLYVCLFFFLFALWQNFCQRLQYRLRWSQKISAHCCKNDSKRFYYKIDSIFSFSFSFSSVCSSDLAPVGDISDSMSRCCSLSPKATMVMSILGKNECVILCGHRKSRDFPSYLNLLHKHLIIGFFHQRGQTFPGNA